jgi:hypothetical protein
MRKREIVLQQNADLEKVRWLARILVAWNSTF